MLPPALMAITFHEVSHGFIADRLGDKTARYMGRLTLNPLKHLDVIGTIMIFVAHIGWAKPVPVNFRNLRHPKTDMIWVAAAGPTTNFLLAFLSAFALRGILAAGDSIPAYVADPLLLMLIVSVLLNLSLAFFNLIPVLPLDGGRVMVGLLPADLSVKYSRLEPYGMIIIILLVVLFPGVISRYLSIPVDKGINILIGDEISNSLKHKPGTANFVKDILP